MQMSGPTAYVASLLGNDNRWKEGVVQAWNVMPPTERFKLPGLGSRGNHTVQEGARALRDLQSLGFLCGRDGELQGYGICLGL